MHIEITEENIDALLREYDALSFSLAHRKLSVTEAARHEALEKAFYALPSRATSPLDILIENHYAYIDRQD